jgi:hypothetical protein
MSIAVGHKSVTYWLMPLLTLRVVNTIYNSLLSGMIWPGPMKRWYRKKFHRYGRQVHRMPEMQCPICGVVVTDIVMKVPPDKSLLRCAECGVHFLIGRAAPVLSFVKSSIGPITLPKDMLGANRLATWSPLGFPATRSTTH